MKRSTLFFLIGFIALFIVTALGHMPFKSVYNDAEFWHDNTAERKRLAEISGKTLLDIQGDNGSIHVDASVNVPEEINIYRSISDDLNIDRLATAMGMIVVNSESEESFLNYAARAYEIGFSDTFYENGYISSAENGYIEYACVYLNEAVNLTEERIHEIISQSGLDNGFEFEIHKANQEWCVVQLVDDIPMATQISYDEVLGLSSDRMLLRFADEAGALVLRGKTVASVQKIGTVNSIVSVDGSADNIRQVLTTDYHIDRIRLAYQARVCVGNPFENVLYPVWELYQEGFSDYPVLVLNALSGEVEQYVNIY